MVMARFKMKTLFPVFIWLVTSVCTLFLGVSWQSLETRCPGVISGAARTVDKDWSPTSDRKRVAVPGHVEVTNPQPPRKILLDCGANVASSVQFFRETYPGGRDFTIHSFEIDDRLTPYFKPYDKHHLHCPVGVTNRDGNMTAYQEMAWRPDKGNGRHPLEIHWGGGSLFASEKEKKDPMGGARHLTRKKTIPVVDISQWIMRTVSKDDYVIFKLDVEGAEFEVLRKMLENRTFDYIDKFYGELHDWFLPAGWSKADKVQLENDLKTADIHMIDWLGEGRQYGDIESIHPVKVPRGTPGVAGRIYSACSKGSVALSVAVGMNYKRAHKVVETLGAHRVRVPTTLFVYGDFVQMFPKTVKSWAENFNIGIREDGHYPPGHLEEMAGAWFRMGLISAVLRLEEIGINASYYLPTVKRDITDTIIFQAQRRGLRIIKAAVEFPAKEGSDGQLSRANYYKFTDEFRNSMALLAINDALTKSHGGVLTLDSDLPDTYMISAFLMDYLVETSGFKLVTLDKCVATST